MLDILPQKLFFRAAIRARERLVESFAKYYADGSYKRGSDYIQKFTQHCVRQGVPDTDMPRMLLGTVFNNVANTVPSAFWAICHIFSDRCLLKEIRDELERNAVVPNAEKGATDAISTIDLSRLTNSSYCPVLLSTYHEVFRYHGMANSVRVVSEDHLLNGRFLLRKGGLVMISARAQHRNSEVWGSDVDEFQPHRFNISDKKRDVDKGKQQQQQGRRGNRINPVAFRGFGGGVTLCPGRHFATAEILLLVALLVLRFDIQPVGGLPWAIPSTANSSQAEAVEQPDQDIEVRFTPLPGVRKRTWRVASSGRRDVSLLAQK
ncbi:hypothetical protein PG991_009679 [Apiospora marii]|uniref:Cytochrome P450 n=2 Tax=Apiospora marii TaxID=335849 RepID=A0ABR1RID6_9PEZI